MTTSEWVTEEVTVDGIVAEVEAHFEGWYSEGDAWGYGCEPPDGDFNIDEVEYKSARTYDEEGNVSNVEITDEIKSLVEKELYKVEFTERTFEPDYDDYYE